MSADRADTPRPPVALLVGGSRGLGLAMARDLAGQGWALALAARDPEQLRAAADDLVGRRPSVRIETFPLDVADAEAVAAAVAATEERLGPVALAICVAGVIQVGPLEALGREHFREAVDTMLWGPVNTAAAVLPGMRARGHGRIGVITSVGGLVAAPHLLPYSTAKFGAVGFARGLRTELTGTGVTVTTVVPGLMRTGSHRHAEFVGAQGEEFAWFAPAASVPGLSMDAGRAARRIVRAVRQGRAELWLTPLTQLAGRVAGLSPRLTAAVLALTVRLLPDASGGHSDTVEGHEARRRMPSRTRALVDRLTTLGDRASDRMLQR
ncbi:NAD(P)-dependent dehydrogenase (short-subunit alcohol dehydrogenase family) [Friedmanniella endophytica]|uniref:NAD(P)-dependent dehydrogenase (Short-subunit alcohol dehydrogenase family) n=1 Tax=Microlunatus kandeliicorticis TaxID=1759536 RepID=A0A7W3P6G3_9ACTN|nr:SDR family oxidoreductase [Microlunatus kandeliicorticis]MBA8795016.1 NAD(P)-dependent dehydrogenase (short-subunit alcohol dehydrogenase family) [Microlunatus kandeliicorticis]